LAFPDDYTPGTVPSQGQYTLAGWVILALDRAMENLAESIKKSLTAAPIFAK
jgi:hypothetical protein